MLQCLRHLILTLVLLPSVEVDLGEVSAEFAAVVSDTVVEEDVDKKDEDEDDNRALDENEDEDWDVENEGDCDDWDEQSEGDWDDWDEENEGDWDDWDEEGKGFFLRLLGLVHQLTSGSVDELRVVRSTKQYIMWPTKNVP